MREAISLTALVLLVGASWTSGDVGLFGVGAALVYLLCWEVDR